MNSACHVTSGKFVMLKHPLLMQTVTDTEPGGFDDATEVSQVRADFSSPPNTVAPRSRQTGPSSGRLESGQTWEERQRADGKCELGGPRPGGYSWQAVLLPAASLSTLMMWERWPAPLPPRVSESFKPVKATGMAAATSIKLHMVLIEKH